MKKRIKKKIVIAGGTGFIGQALEKHFTRKNYQLVILTRKPKLANHVYWDAKNLGPWVAEVEGADVLINLCGKSVDCRYNEKNKKEILESRIAPTKLLNKVVEMCTQKPKVLRKKLRRKVKV